MKKAGPINTKKKRSDFPMKKGKREDYPNITSTTSSMDTTGMMPTPPQSNAERESYEELAGMEIPKKKKGK